MVAVDQFTGHLDCEDIQQSQYSQVDLSISLVLYQYTLLSYSFPKIKCDMAVGDNIKHVKGWT